MVIKITLRYLILDILLTHISRGGVGGGNDLCYHKEEKIKCFYSCIEFPVY